MGGQVTVSIILSGHFGSPEGVELKLSDNTTAILDGAGRATWTYLTTDVGDTELTVIFEGNVNNAPIKESVGVEVVKASPTVVLKPDVSRIAVGGEVAVSISLSGFYGPTKGLRLTVADNTTNTTIILDGSGKSVWVYKASKSAPTTLTVSYAGGDSNEAASASGNITVTKALPAFNGGPNNEPSMGNVVVTVNKASPSLTLNSIQKRVTVGRPVNVSIELKGYHGSDEGVVLHLSDGTTTSVKPSGHATWTHTTTRADTKYDLTAKFHEDHSNEAAEGTNYITVDKAVTALYLTADPAVVRVGGQVKIIIHLTGHFGPTEGQMLTLWDNTTTTLDKFGKAESTFIATSAGLTTLTGRYGGDANNEGDDGSVVVTVLKATPKLDLNADSTKVSIGHKVRGIDADAGNPC